MLMFNGGEPGPPLIWQTVPAATTLTSMGASPVASSGSTPGGACVYKVIACETGGAAALIRIAIAVGGAADNIKQYIAYNYPLTGGESAPFEGPFELAPTDVIRVYSDTGNVSFSAFGFNKL